MGLISVHCAVIDHDQAQPDVAAALDRVADPRFGAAALFIGKVRDHSHGRPSLGVSYDVFEPLAERLFADIASTSAAACDHDIRVCIEHASGRLAIGDIAVVVAVGSAHRRESLQLCATIIERVKHEAPIWKQEHFSDGDSEWVQGCALCAPASGDATVPASVAAT
ncbi:MAG: molybdenum cofactor biosynthesis protein MoaE [Wenzhouxiangellaceae bacterium]